MLITILYSESSSDENRRPCGFFTMKAAKLESVSLPSVLLFELLESESISKSIWRCICCIMSQSGSLHVRLQVHWPVHVQRHLHIILHVSQHICSGSLGSTPAVNGPRSVFLRHCFVFTYSFISLLIFLLPRHLLYLIKTAWHWWCRSLPALPVSCK